MNAEKTYEYKHPHPAVSVDCAIFTILDDILMILLVERGVPPFEGQHALPGGFVGIDEDLPDAAQRELTEETGIEGFYLEQLGAFGRPERDPRERVITVAYFAVVAGSRLEAEAGSDARAAGWFPAAALPTLAFDHEEIVAHALATIRARLKESTLALQFLPPEFTLSELQHVHEVILGEPVDKRNFRKWANSFEYIEDTGRHQEGQPHRPAKLYRASSSLRQEGRNALPKPMPLQASAVTTDDRYEEGYRAGFTAAKTAVSDAIRKLGAS